MRAWVQKTSTTHTHTHTKARQVSRQGQKEIALGEEKGGHRGGARAPTRSLADVKDAEKGKAGVEEADGIGDEEALFGQT